MLPPSLLLPLARADDQLHALDIVETGSSTTTPDGRTFEQLNQEDHFRIDISKLPPDEGYLDALTPPLMRWNSSRQEAEVTRLDPESRYLTLLRRTAIEEALKARGMLSLLIGGNSGIRDYLRTSEKTGAQYLKEAICRLDPEHRVCSLASSQAIRELSFALPCETKALFNLFDDNCPDPRFDPAWGGHQAMMAPTRNRSPLRDQAMDDARLFRGKFESIRRIEAYLQRPLPASTDYQPGMESAQKLRDKVLGTLIYHSLQLIELKRLERFIKEDLVRDAATENLAGVEGANFTLEQEKIQKIVQQKFGPQLDRIAIAHNTILSQVPFLAVRVGDRPFFEFIYCFLQGRSNVASAQAGTQYCGEGVGFPDFYLPMITTSANQMIRDSETIELPNSFRGRFRALIEELESEGYQNLERRIMSHSGWALKKLLTESLAANTVSLAALSNTSRRFVTTTGAGQLDHCRQVGRHCRMLENLARHDLLHEQTKRRFGTFLNADFFPAHSDSLNGMDAVRAPILNALQRADASQDRVRDYVDYFLWGVIAVEVAVTFGMGASVSTPLQMGVRYSMTTASMANLAVAYANFDQSMTEERYLSAMFRGIPGTIGPDEMSNAEEMTANDMIQFHSSLMVAVSDFMVLDRIFRATGLVARGAARLVFRTPGVKQWTLQALQKSAALAERGGIIRPILTNRAIQMLEGLSVFGPNFVKAVPANLAIERMAVLEGRSAAWIRARLGERFGEWFSALARAPNAAMEALARRMHNSLLSDAAVTAGEAAWYRRGLKGWLNRLMGRTMAESIRRGAGLANDVPLDYVVTVPWLRDFMRTEVQSAGLMTLVNVYQRSQAGTLSQTQPQVAADLGMDLALMFFVVMRSPSRVDRISRVSARDLAPGRPSLYIAHPYARSATMLTPIIAMSSVVGAASTIALNDDKIDTPEKWERYLRQSRNRMLFDVGYISLITPHRSNMRESVYEEFQNANALGRLAINGYYAFDFTVLAYPLYIYGRDALGLDHLPPQVRSLLGDGKVFLSVRAPGATDPNDALLPTASSVLARFALQ